MKKSLSIVLCAFLFSCTNKGKTSSEALPFFHFDKIDYYHSAISRETLDSIGMNQEKSRKDQALLQLMNGRVPVSTIDTLFIKNMDVLSFEKAVIDTAYHEKIARLFSLRTPKTRTASACSQVYRDILVFRKKDKVIGVAKICFECGQNHIVGARYNSADFGMSGEYKELYEILKSIR